jgi:hypothetical protein
MTDISFMRKKLESLTEELQEDKQHHEKLYKRYRKCCSILYYTQWISNMISVGCYSTALSTLGTAIGIPIAFTASGIGVTANGLSIFCNELSKRKVNKLKMHAQVLTICRNFEMEMIQCCVKSVVSTEDFNLALDLINKYYSQKEQWLNKEINDTYQTKTRSDSIKI